MALTRPVLTLLYAGLGTIIAAECLGGAAPVAEAPVRHATARPAPTPVADPAPLAETILARPLFDPTRRPPPVALLTTATQHTAAIAPPKERLAGTITADHVRVAMFIRDPEEKSLALGIGGRLGAWQVTAIYPDRVALRADDGGMLIKSLTGTTVPLQVSWLRDWKPAKFHREE
jgi:hypothetical protein